MKFIQALILALFCGQWCAAGNIVNYTQKSTVNLRPYFSVAEDDKEGTLNADLLFRNPELFRALNDFSPAKPDNVFWLFTEIKSDTDAAAVLSFRHLANATLYVLPDTPGASYEQRYAGAFCPDSMISSGDSRFHFRLTFARGIKYRILIRSLHTKKYDPVFDFKLSDRDLFYKASGRKERLDYWFQGAGMLLLVYVLVNWLSTRYRPYLWMGIFIAGLQLYNLALNRYLIDWFFPNHPVVGWRFTVHFLYMAIIGLYLLIIDFWNIKSKHPNLYRLGKVILCGMPLLALLFFFINYYTSNFKLTSQINSVLFMVQLYYLLRLLSLWKSFDKQERFLAYGVILYLAVALFVSVSVFIVGERVLGLVTVFSGVLQTTVCLLFLVGINGKLWQNEADKLHYLSQLNELQREQNQLLEANVAARTKELHQGKLQIELLIDELNHRVKNNLQLLYSLNSLQVSAHKDQYVTNILKDNVARIKAMMLVNESLDPGKNNSSELFAPGVVINKIAAHLKQIFAGEVPVRINIDIEESIILNAASGLSLGLIITELMTNSLKHAFAGQPEPEISISLYRSLNNWELHYRDNGKGMLTQSKDSFGLNLISDLTRQLRGSYKIDPVNGVHYVFIFPNVS
ncbi:MAG: hypothetical protein JNM21_15845 [Taibaiella sp.]|nr:hypothetical protein [Taibaiella sp.]